MLSSINEKNCFRLGNQFQLIEENSKPFLKHIETNARVETDSLGKKIITSLPATREQLIETFKTFDLSVSHKLLDYYLKIFWRSGIIGLEENGSCKFSEKSTQKKQKILENISMVIVAFNGEKFIFKNLESIYRQTFLPGEVIIVDNASKDHSIEKVEQEFKEVKIIRNKRNVHYARAVNIGVEEAKGDLVIVLNQDLVLEKDFIDMIYSRYSAEKDKELVAGIVPQMRFSQLPTFTNGIGNFITEKSWGSDNYFGVVDIGQFDQLSYVGSACFGAIMVTKKGWQRVGELDIKYKSFYEDVDWSMRSHLIGMKLLAAPEALVYHEFGGSYPSGIKLTFIAKNRMRFVLKFLKGKLLRKFFINYLKLDIKSILYFLRHRSIKNIYYYMKGYLKLLVECPGILKHRRKNKTDIKIIKEFFNKHTPYVALSNKNLNPVINKDVIRGYYYFTETENFNFPEDPIMYKE